MNALLWSHGAGAETPRASPPVLSPAVVEARALHRPGEAVEAVALLVAPAERQEAYATYELGKALNRLGLVPLALHYYLVTIELDSDGFFDRYVYPKAAILGRYLGDYHLLTFLWEPRSVGDSAAHGPAGWAFQRARCEISLAEVEALAARWAPVVGRRELLRDERRRLRGKDCIDFPDEVREVLWRRHREMARALREPPLEDVGAHCPKPGA